MEITLTAARKNTRMTQYAFAKAVGVSRSTIVNWEKGTSQPSAQQFKLISKISGIPMECIILPSEFTNMNFQVKHKQGVTV